MSKDTRAPTSKPHLVAALAYDGLCTFEFGCAVELFSLERPELGVPWYEFGACSLERGKVRADGGISVSIPHTLTLLDRADTIIIPGWRDAEEQPPREITHRVKKAFDRGARICSICSGVFVLAAAGILDGKRATTHWRYARLLAEKYPRIEVLPNALYVDEGRIMTSAGSAAGLDMLIHLVRKDYGHKICNEVARRLVISPHRQGGQAQFIPSPVPRDERGRLARLMDWVQTHLAEPHTVESLAKRASMSPRTLHREFRRETGESVYLWIIRQRVDRARELLEDPRVPLARVMEIVGMNSLETLRHHFRRVVGITPAAYRLRFGREHRFSK